MRLENRIKRWLQRQPAAVLSIAITISICWLQTTNTPDQANFLQRLDFVIYDIRMQHLLPLSTALSKTKQAHHKVVIVDIDEKSLKEIGRWPWSRHVMSALVKHLSNAQVAVIGFDIVFGEPEQNPAAIIAATTNDITIQKKLIEIRPDFDFDRQFAQQIKHANADIIAGYFFHSASDITSGYLAKPPPIMTAHDAERTIIRTMTGYAANIEAIQNSAHSTGFVSVFPDSDGSIRRVPLLLKYGQDIYPSLGLSIAKTYLLADTIKLEAYASGSVDKVSHIKIDNLSLPTDATGQMLIPYKGQQGSFPYISASDILNGKSDNQMLANSIVLVGSSAIGVFDFKPTPLSASFPGVEIQATIVDSILRGNLIASPDWALGATIVILIATGLFLILILPRVGPIFGGLVSLCLFAGAIVANFYLWHHHKLDLSLASTLVEIVLIFTIYTIYGFYTESMQRIKIKSMFGQYVATAHIDELLSDPDNLSFDGETKEMTVLFADIRNFTSISEKLSAVELKQLLNRFFDPMTEIIFSQQGTIDKYVGDMIMAFWGAPLDDAEQCQHAVTAALNMLAAVDVIKPQFAADGLPEINIGIGLNTGLMNVGDMGSTFRRAYTVLGDAVNLGSRLESVTKYYGVKCLVSESTYQKTSGILFRLVDFIQVKGKEEPIKVYEPICFKENVSATTMEYIGRYEDARKNYLSRQWHTALSLYQELLEKDPHHKQLYQIYIDRINGFIAHPPDNNWEGVFQHTSK